MENIYNFCVDLVRNNYFFGALISFIIGALMAFTPCSLSKIPLVIAYVGNVHSDGVKTDFWLSVVFSVGSAILYTAFGVLASVVGSGFMISKWTFVLLGVVMLLMALQLTEIVSFIPTIDISHKNKKKGIIGAFIAGILGGLVMSPCATPFLVVILGIIASKHDIVYGVILMLMYSLGNGALTIIAGTYTGFVRKLKQNEAYGKFDKVMRWSLAIIVAIIGFYFLYQAM